MKQNPLNLLFAMVLGTLVLTGCSRSDDESPVPSAAQPDEPQSRLKQDPHGGTVITLDPATQAVMDLRVAPLASAEWKPGLDAFGRVLDLAPLAELVAELGRAQMEFDAAHAELERMKVLRQQNNTSEKAFQAAESACQLSQTAASAIRLRIRNAWGEKLAEMTGPMTVPVGSQRKRDPVLEDLLDGRRMLVQVELTADQLPAQPPDHARFVSLGDDPLPVPAVYFDTTRTVDPQTQRRGLLFLTGTSPAKLAPGMALAAHVGTGGAPETGVVVPRAAVVRFNGAGWVYLQTGEDTFVRRGVALDRPLIDGWFVGGELEADAEVVVTGAQLLLSEELKGRGVGE